MEVKVQEETKGIGEKEIGTVSVDPTFYFFFHWNLIAF